MKTLGVAITCIVISLSSLLFLSEVRQNLSGIHEQRKLAEFWQRQVALNELTQSIENSKLADYKQDIAQLVPGALAQAQSADHQKNLRSLASVLPHVREKIELGTRAKVLLAQGKEKIVERKFEEGIAQLEELLERFPDSHHCVEARYLMLESYVNLEKFDAALLQLETMVDIYPSNRLTGYALLKVGGLYERKSRLEDALQIYRTILSVFQDDPNLMALANKNVKLLEL